MSVVASTELATRRRRGRSIPLLRGTGIAGHAAALVIVLLVVIVIFGPALAPDNPNAVHLSEAYFGPSPQHLLGQDSLGRDLLSRLLVGARTALIGPALVVLLATIAGVALALSAAWFGGLFDATVSRFSEAMFAFPAVLLAIFAVALFGTGLTAPVVALAIAYTPYMTRLIRSAALRARVQPYIDALDVQGASAWRICTRHLLPNVLPLVIAQSTIAFGYAILELGAISYLGLGVQPPHADWALMVNSGQAGVVAGYPAEALLAGGCIVVAIVAFNVLGERLVDRADYQ